MKKSFSILIIICILICGCTDINNEHNIESNDNINNDETKEEETYLIDNFITKLNENSSINLLNLVEYDAQNKDSGFYRTEFRLNPFKENKSIHANINDNNTTIDIVNYNLDSTIKGQQIRIYINTNDIDNVKKLFPIILKLFTENVNNDEINNILSNLEDTYGEYETVLVDNNKVNGYIQKSNYWEIFLDK